MVPEELPGRTRACNRGRDVPVYARAHHPREGIRGLRGCLTEMLFRPKGVAELLDLHISPRGLLHEDCIPRSTPPPCPKCGRRGFRLPKEPILDAASLPSDLDLFRLRNFATVLIVTERFKNVDAMVVYPCRRQTLVVLLLAAALPLLPVLTTTIPLAEIVKTLFAAMH